MNRIRQYIPGSVDADPEVRDFNTTEELLALDIVARQERYSDFDHYALDGNRLVVVGTNGKVVFIVGTLDSQIGVDIPQYRSGLVTPQPATPA